MPKVLIVDDDEQIIRAINKILTRRQFETDTAQNGEEALVKLRSNSYDLILTDIIMPQKEGIQLIHDVRENYPDTPIVAMSGGGRMKPDDYLEVAEKLGAESLLKKPFSSEDLLNLIETVLQK